MPSVEEKSANPPMSDPLLRANPILFSMRN